jgi:hypothetical protein
LLYTLALVFNNSKGFSGADYLVEKMTSFDDGDFTA